MLFDFSFMSFLFKCFLSMVLENQSVVIMVQCVPLRLQLDITDQ